MCTNEQPCNNELLRTLRTSEPGGCPDEELEFAHQLIDYIDSSPTPFHVCETTVKMLQDKGFEELREDEPWQDAAGSKLKPGGKYYYTRNMSTLVAFIVGGKATSESIGGLKVAGGHTDSPVLKVKPSSKRSANGYLQVNVETYGGGLWHTWFDRELSLAGCVIVKTAQGFERRLVHIKRPLLRVPNLCIHLQTAEERGKFAPNKETHLQPILSTIQDSLEESPDPRHPPELLQLLSQELGCAVDDIKDFELTLFDTQPGQVWGLRSEFLSAPRIDNLVHCFTATHALIEYAASSEFAVDTDVSMIALFDHEEVGSESSAGAGSPVFQDAISRVSSCVFGRNSGIPAEECSRVCARKSFLVSADVAHAIHPNYASKHEPAHSPILNQGTVIKTNDNQRYATNAVTGFIFREIARQARQGVQEFVVKNDCPCGMTIGPIISAKTGVKTLDVGVASWSMHSIRETCGVADIANNFNLLYATFLHARDIMDSLASESLCPPCSL